MRSVTSSVPHSDETPDATPEELAPTNLLSSDDPAVAAARLMFVMTNGVAGITLSERQIGVIAGSSDLGAFGFKGTKKSPGRLVAQEFGILGDALGDTFEADAPDYLDLRNARLSGDSSAETVDVALDLNGLFPDADPIDATSACASIATRIPPRGPPDSIDISTSGSSASRPALRSVSGSR